jgi:hypothetical protein
VIVLLSGRNLEQHPARISVFPGKARENQITDLSEGNVIERLVPDSRV